MFPNIKQSLLKSNSDDQRQIIMNDMRSLFYSIQRWNSEIYAMFTKSIIINYLWQIVDKSNNDNLINDTLWFIAEMQNQNIYNQSVVHENGLQILLKVLRKCINCNIATNGFYILSQVADSNPQRKMLLINNVCFKLFWSKMQTFNSFIVSNLHYLSLWSNASLLLCNLSTTTFSSANMKYFFKMLFSIMSFSIKIQSDPQNTSIKRQLILNQILINGTLTLYKLTQNSSNIDTIINEFRKNPNFLTKCVQLMRYKNSKRVRNYTILWINHIFAQNVNFPHNVDILLQNGVLMEYIAFAKQEKSYGTETTNILISLSNLLLWNKQHRLVILNDSTLLNFITTNLYHKDSLVVMAALDCVNNILQFKQEEDAWSLLLKYNHGKVFDGICHILNDKNKQRWQSLTHENVINIMDCLRNISHLIESNCTSTKWIQIKLKQANVIDIIKFNLHLICNKKDQNGKTINVVNINFMTNLALKNYIPAIEQLTQSLK